MILKGIFGGGSVKQRRNVWVVSGPSSCGKSTFILNEKSKLITGLPADALTYLPSTFHRKELKADGFLHYNILWPAYRNMDPYDFDHEKTWQKVMETNHFFKAVILKTDLEVILDRLRKREIVESKKITLKSEKKYKNEKWLKIYERIDLEKLYQSWADHLKRKKIPYISVDANSNEYSIIENTLDNG